MLTIFYTDDRVFSQMQTQWASQLNPLLQSPIANGALLQEVSLAVGLNQIQHGLDRDPIGYIITRQRAVNGGIFDTQDDNPNPKDTLWLNAAAAVVVDIIVF